MIKRLAIILIAAIALLSPAACGKKQDKRYEATFLQLFDTVTEVIGYAKNEEEFMADAQKIRDLLMEYHQLYDIYNDYEGISNIKTINDNAGIAPVKVDQRIIDLLEFGEDAYEMSGGKVNIAFGAVLKVWHDYREAGTNDPENAQLPPYELLEEKARHTDISMMVIDKENSTVYLKDKEMSIDVGAIAKGYATEQVAEIMEEAGFEKGLISIGGNVRAIGSRIDDTNWNVGIQDPDLESEKKNLFVLKLSDYSLVTSGDYQRYYTVYGKTYHHIIDPETLMPADHFKAVSIVCPDSGFADALSTAVFTLPFEQGLSLVEGLEEVEAVWVFTDGSIRSSSGFEGFLGSMD